MCGVAGRVARSGLQPAVENIAGGRGDAGEFAPSLSSQSTAYRASATRPRPRPHQGAQSRGLLSCGSMAPPPVEFGDEEKREMFTMFYEKHKPEEVKASVAMAMDLSKKKGFGTIRKALERKYKEDPLLFWKLELKKLKEAGKLPAGKVIEPEPDPEPEPEPEVEKPPRVIPVDHDRLAHTWVVWAQKAPLPNEKRGQLVEVGDFATVQEFWSTWRWVPLPSTAFNQPVRTARDRLPTVIALAMFKDGVEPKRKHKANEHGGMWSSIQIQRRGDRVGLGPPPDALENGLVDDLWNNLVYGCVGETIDRGDEITGVRVVDQRAQNRGVVLELWFRNFAKKDDVKRLQGEMERILIDGHPAVTGQPQVKFECTTWKSNVR